MPTRPPVPSFQFASMRRSWRLIDQSHALITRARTTRDAALARVLTAELNYGITPRTRFYAERMSPRMQNLDGQT